MSQLEDIELAQRSLEESFSKRMAELEAQLHNSGTAKDTVARVAEEFRTFRELVFNMLGLLRHQIKECHQSIDIMETRHRRKSLVFLGLSEKDKENSEALILDVIHGRLGMKNISSTDINYCHRIGALNKDRPRPLLVRFCRFDHRSSVWRAKSSLKGSSVTVREFLTRTRQAIFTKARLNFGMRSCWSQDGVIVVKTPDGSRHKLTSAEDLNELMVKYPRASCREPASSRSGPEGVSSVSGTSLNRRK